MEADEKTSWEHVATTFAFLAQVASNAPDEVSARELLDAVRAADCVGSSGGYETMKRYAEKRAQMPIDEVARELGVDWTFLFRGMNSQKGPKPPYAGVWLSSDGVGVEEMCAVNACYVEAGFGAGASATNRHDYFGVELEFVSRLARRIARDDERAPVLLASFVDRYLLSWFDSFVEDAQAKSATTFWAGYLDLVGASLREVRSLLPQ